MMQFLAFGIRIGAMVASLAATAIAPLAAQGTRAAVLLTLPTSTRALGLGDASGAALADEWAVFLAPAQLARVGTLAAGVASESYLASTQLSALAFAVPAWRGTIGIGARLLDYGTVREIASQLPGLDGVETGRTVSAQDHSFVVGYARALPRLRGIRAGATVELFRTRVADLSGQGTTASGGLAWTSPSGWDLAASVQHVGSGIRVGATFGELPQTWRAAVASPTVQVRNARLKAMAELKRVRGGVTSGTLGGELIWVGIRGTGLSLRSAYSYRDRSDDRAPLSIGAGVGLGRFTLDYAVERFSRIDQVTHRVGLRFVRASAGSASPAK